jgi:hypothetical protein
MALERESAAFRAKLPELLLHHNGRYALIHGDRVEGDTFPTFDDALEAGYERFELDAFLVKLIAEHENPVFFPRAIKPCR